MIRTCNGSCIRAVIQDGIRIRVWNQNVVIEQRTENIEIEQRTENEVCKILRDRRV